MILKRLRLPGLFLVATGLLGTAARTPAVTRNDLRVDQAVEALRAPALTAVARGLDLAFGPVAGVLIIVLLAAALALAGRVRTAVLVTVMITAGWTTCEIFKQVIARPRPPMAGSLLHEIGHDGFPSGHVALTLSLVIAAGFLTAGTRLFRLVVSAGVVLVAVQALARMYLGVHYPTDVIGSVLAAGAGTSAVIALRDDIDRWIGRMAVLTRPGDRAR
ncbi:phosphatase PAP2 family protein [Sphaerisporangium rhizosphaerae]|uniref:Phosphatase PAP2 family protein n=1 Tax=Sphaerisporangium rhizosphaerae TaxID=2269375 RepID=A0ABW2P695_9ACTN